MLKTLMVGLTEKDMQAEVNSYDLNPYYFPTLFPLKEQKSLTWKTLRATIGLKIAGDLVARGASIDAKTRDAIKRIEGDIPKIAIKREKDENELNEYDIMVAMASGDADLVQLVEFWAEDTNYCWTGVAARLEHMALFMISHGGRFYVNLENNAHVVTEYDCDYEIPADQKAGATVNWADSANAKPFSVDLKNLVQNSRAASKGGIRLRHMWINQETFNTLVETKECQEYCASYVANALGLQKIPGIAEVNAMMAKLPYLYGLQLHIIDQDITIEKPDGPRESGNPFATNVVLFTEGTQLGRTYWKRPKDMDLKGSAAIKVMREYCCIKKFATEDPITETTMGIANAFPGWSGSERSYFLDTKNNSWNEGK